MKIFKHLPLLLFILGFNSQLFAASSGSTTTNSMISSNMVPQNIQEMELLKAFSDQRKAFWRQEYEKANLTVEKYISLLEEENQRMANFYETLIKKNPDSYELRVSCGDFYYDAGLEEESVRHYEKALQIRADDPDLMNNLANHYGHGGEVMKAFPLYDKAVQINPTNAVVQFNRGTTIFMMRKDAKEYYGWDEPTIFREGMKSLKLARDLAPERLDYAVNYASSFHLIKPEPDWNEAVAAWENCLAKTAPGTPERDKININLARVYLKKKDFQKAKETLDHITSPAESMSKKKLLERIQRESQQASLK